jgi:outer membrane protein TolC
MLGGGTAALNFNTNRLRFGPDGGPLNPRTDSSLEASVTQPLLQGGGRPANLAPIVLARIDTERSYFQLKDGVQQLVQGVIEAYWALVFARTDLWARNRQSEQAEQAFDRAQARLESGLGDLEDVAQSRVALANFRSNLIAAQGNVLLREAALRNILGLPPDSRDQIVPTTVPDAVEMEFNWPELMRLAEENRPDIIELKLVLEADQQQIILANNEALPSVDAVMVYRWDGLQGVTPARRQVAAAFGELTDWTLGVNFSVPLGLRAARAQLRQRELILAADRANLEQSLHNAVHLLALTLRNVDQNYQQYLAFRETREAAHTNLEMQLAAYNAGLSIFLNVLLAITDWGNAVSAEAQALTQYNIALAELERQTGTILETHGVRFYEERWESIGPLGRLHRGRLYPSSILPGANADRYPQGERAAEQFFDLRDPLDDPLLPALPPPPSPEPLRLPPPLDE